MSEMSPEEVAERLEKAITDGMQFTASDFPPHPDGRRFHVGEFGREWQVHGLGLAHVCMCSSVRMADMVAEALEKLSREQGAGRVRAVVAGRAICRQGEDRMRTLAERARQAATNSLNARRDTDLGSNAELLNELADEIEMCQATIAELREKLEDAAVEGSDWKSRALRAEVSVERLRAIVEADDRRFAWLAGGGVDCGPVVEGFSVLLDDFWRFLGDAIRERIGEENDSPDIKGTDEDRIKAFRAMIDAAMAAEKARGE